MFPYAEKLNNYWTGYYTSRANSKFQVRRGQANLHAANQFFVMKALNQSTSSDQLKDIRHASNSMLNSLGVYQHHDGITGTAKDHVANNYYKHLKESMETNNEEYAKILAQIAEDSLGLKLK